MILILKSFIIILLSTCVSAQLDAYTSTSELEIFVETQGRLLKTLQKYYEKEQNRIAFIEKYLNDSQEEYDKASNSDPEVYFGNPITAFKYMKRLSADLKYVEKVMNSPNGFRRDETVRYPTKRDLIGATKGLILLQKVYKLNVSDLAQGILRGNFSADNQPFIEQVQPMREADLYIMLFLPTKALGHELKLAWLMELLKYTRSRYCEDCLDETEVIDNILEEYLAVGNTNETKKWINERISLKPKDPKSKKYRTMLLNLKKNANNKLHLTDLRRTDDTKDRDKSADKDQDKINEQREQMMSLCARDFATNVNRKSLKCFYKYDPHPLLRLARVKMEYLHRRPDVMLFHDVINDAEIQTLRELAKSRAAQRTKAEKKASILSQVEIYVAKVAYFEDDLELVARISRRISHFTGLSMSLSDRLIAVNYGVGGHYVHHYDFNDPKKAEYSNSSIASDRLATIMFYLSNVEQGGATLFLKLGLRVYPVKGAALYWHNLYPSGDGNYMTMHLSCPVLRGNKWISVKWPREAGQSSCPIWYSNYGVTTEERIKYIKAFDNARSVIM